MTSYSDRDAAVSTTPTGSAAIASTYAKAGNAERLSAGSTTFRTSLLSPAPASATTNGTTTWALRDPDGALLAVRIGSAAAPNTATSHYAFADQVDSVRALVTAAGTLTAAYSYTSYGVVRTKTGSITNPFQYGGGFTDEATGLVKLGIRFYDPQHGRFT